MAPNPAAASSSAGIGEPASASHRPHSRSDRPEDAAARNRAHSRSWAAGPHRSRLVLSSTVRTKWAASRWAASTLASPASGFHHQRWREPVIRCGSNSHTVLPDPARSCAVAAHKSALLDVATTAPGADRT